MSQRGQDVKRTVQAFYDSVGWKELSEGIYQNARFEDLRPVSREYIHRCHMRVKRHIPSRGRYLLDAGSGPIQYPEYLEYSQGYCYRVCLDISHRALLEARKRIDGHGLFVVGDIAHLPFKEGAFDGLVSLHTVHHLPAQEQPGAFSEFLRVLRAGGQAAVVYSWGKAAPWMRRARPLMRAIERFRARAGHNPEQELQENLPIEKLTPEAAALLNAGGSFTHHNPPDWVRAQLSWLPGLEMRVWRSVSPAFLRAFIHSRLLGRYWLKLLYRLEEIAPHFFARVGQYPMILFQKPAQDVGEGDA